MVALPVHEGTKPDDLKRRVSNPGAPIGRLQDQLHGQMASPPSTKEGLVSEQESEQQSGDQQGSNQQSGDQQSGDQQSSNQQSSNQQGSNQQGGDQQGGDNKHGSEGGAV